MDDKLDDIFNNNYKEFIKLHDKIISNSDNNSDLRYLAENAESAYDNTLSISNSINKCSLERMLHSVMDSGKLLKTIEKHDFEDKSEYPLEIIFDKLVSTSISKFSQNCKCSKK